MSDPTTELLRQIGIQTTELVNYQKELSTAVNSMAVTMARMEESHGYILREHASQKEKNESTNFKIENLQEEIHGLEKKFIKIEYIPTKLATLEKRITNAHEKINDLEKNQTIDEHNWATMSKVGKWFADKALIPLITTALAGISAVYVYLKVGG